MGGFDGFGFKPSECKVVNNKIIEHDLAPKSEYIWGSAGSPGIYLTESRRLHVSGNRFELSGIAPHAKAQAAAISLSGCDYCYIYGETYEFQENLPISNWVKDVRGFKNYINNGKPPKKYSNARCTYLTAKVGERHREIRARRHQA